MITWRDELVEEARREARMQQAQQQHQKAQNRSSGRRFHPFVISLGAILISMGKSLQRFTPSQSNTAAAQDLGDISYKNVL